MIKAYFNTKDFSKKMENLLAYSDGFLNGAKKGKKQLLAEIGEKTVKMVGIYIDASAKARPDLLHHMYEWYKVGRPSARLFDIEYTVSSAGVTFRSEFLESQSVRKGSDEPFWNKAYIMENGIPVIISPKYSDYLRFKIDDEIIYTSNSVQVDNPGGNTEGQYAKVVDQFFSKYFSQAFLDKSGILDHLGKPIEYKRNLKAGSKRGRSAGIQAGIRWVTNSKGGVE